MFAQQINIPEYAIRQIKEKDLAKTMQVLVSDSLEGRATGKPGGEKAARYIASLYQKMGLQPYNGDSYLQPFNLWEKKRLSFTVQVGDSSLKSDTDIFYIGNIPQNETITREVVYIGDANDTIIAKLDLKDKIALVNFADLSRSYAVTSACEQKGAWAIWGFNAKDNDQFKRISTSYIDFFGNMPLSSSKPRQTEKGSRFFILSNNRIKALTGFTASQLATMDNTTCLSNPIVQTVTFSFPIQIVPVQTWNVIGVLKGTLESSKNIAITAHYDHMGRQANDSIIYGADDNASGVSTLLELAQTYTSMKEKPRHNLMFIAFGAEELGLLGSSYFMDNENKQNFFANINIDMIARHDTATKDNYVYILGTDKSPKLQDICRQANDQTVHLKLDDAYNHSSGFGSFMNRSDHYHFYRNEIPVVSFFSGLHNDYHTTRDTMDKLDFDLWNRRVKLIFSTLYMIDQQDTLK
jgi:hypothetical protein